jgi:hypothetical protein
LIIGEWLPGIKKCRPHADQLSVQNVFLSKLSADDHNKVANAVAKLHEGIKRQIPYTRTSNR